MDLSMKTKTELKHVIAKIFHDLGELLDLLSLQISSEHTYSQNRSPLHWWIKKAGCPTN